MALSLLWTWAVDGVKPNRYDIIGAIFALVGIDIILYDPHVEK